MSLPTTREYTAGAGVPIQSNAFNAIQDAIVGHKHPLLTKPIHGSAFAGATGGPGWGRTGASASPLNLYAPLDLPFGTRVVAVRLYIRDLAAGPTKMQCSVIAASHAGTSAVVASSAVSAGTGADQTLTISTAFLIAAGSLYCIAAETTTGPGGVFLWGAEVDFDRL